MAAAFYSLREAQERIRADMQSDLGYDYFMNNIVETVEGYQMMFNPRAIAATIAYYQDWFDLLPRMKSLIPNCMAHEIPKIRPLCVSVGQGRVLSNLRSVSR